MSCSPLPNADAKIAPRGKTAKPHGTPMSHDGPSGVTRRAKVTAKRAAPTRTRALQGICTTCFHAVTRNRPFSMPYREVRTVMRLVGNSLGLVEICLGTCRKWLGTCFSCILAEQVTGDSKKSNCLGRKSRAISKTGTNQKPVAWPKDGHTTCLIGCTV